jgi:putative Mg2+ transporter-C (MgtC) family protein
MALGAIFLTLLLGGPLEKLVAKINSIKRSSEISGDRD